MIGMVDTPHEVWVFDQVEHVGEPTDAVEAGTVGWIGLSNVAQMIDRGEVLGAGSVAGLLRYLVDHPQS